MILQDYRIFKFYLTNNEVFTSQKFGLSPNFFKISDSPVLCPHKFGENIQVTKKRESHSDFDIAKLFDAFENEYLSTEGSHEKIVEKTTYTKETTKSIKHEIECIKIFLKTNCTCGKFCQKQITENELISSRRSFNQLSWREKGCFLLPLLNSFQIKSDDSHSGRSIYERSREKYNYRIGSDREVCRDTFLFYYDISIRKLKYFQHHLSEVGIIPPNHGNVGKVPINAYSEEDKLNVKLFMINYSSLHGLPDPGRDLRTGVNKLKIFLPAAMSYRSVHNQYLDSLPKSKRPVEYRSFVTIWQELTPNIEFQSPRSDLCQTCEEHIKNIRMAIGRKSEELKIRYYKEALNHLKIAKKERSYYKETIKISKDNLKKHFSQNDVQSIWPKTKKTGAYSMHYSWDFAQQINYPYEDQQIGSIYFKIPRKAQLFGVCCEACPGQVNYLIDEADFLGKGSNTVISLIHHFFSKYGLGESEACLTADNCVGQNKNNSMIHYLLYRTMVGYHDKINLSFMIAGHTKFGPDGYFGLIKRMLRKSKIYTYDNLVDLIRKVSPSGHIQCQSFRDKDGNQCYQYYGWDSWLSEYFCDLPQITKFHHFSFTKNRPGEVIAKETIDGKDHKFNLLKDKNFRFDGIKPDRSFIMKPTGLSNERQWYLYKNIREYIPLLKDKNETCPRPNHPKR